MSRLSIDAVMAAMTDYATAQAEEQAARAEYGGYSWGYHGGGYLAAIETAKAAAEAALNEYIAEVVRREVAKVQP